MMKNDLLEQKHVFVADNFLVEHSNSFKLFGIITVSGSISTIEYTASKFENIIGDNVFTMGDLKTWMSNSKNEDKLVDAMMDLHADGNRCSFSCYLSNQTYSKFIFSLRTLLPNIDYSNMSILKEMDTLYKHINHEILMFPHQNGNSEEVDIIYFHFCQVAKSAGCHILSEELSKVTYSRIKFNNALKLILMAENSMMDYINYMPHLLDLVKNQGENVEVHSFEHNFGTLNLFNNGFFEKISNVKVQFGLEKIVDFRKDKQVQFVSNLMALFCYAWDKFHNTEKIKDLSYLDKVLIFVVWLLFQSPYSGWMISTEDFGKLKVLLQDLRENS